MSNQLEKAVENKIALQAIESVYDSSEVISMLSGEIPGSVVLYHAVVTGDMEKYIPKRDLLRVFFLLNGDITFYTNNEYININERAVFVPDLEQDTKIEVNKNSQFLEIQWELTEDDVNSIAVSDLQFPITQIYDECTQYRETFKSEKSISRSILDHHSLPRFCMGSNESYGYDRVEPHAHPLLDQYFFSFPENDMDLLIDGKIQPFQGNTLIHIPLGSNHGVEIPEGKKMHYLWIDFIIDKKGADYLDEVHILTGVKESFDENNQIQCK